MNGTMTKPTLAVSGINYNRRLSQEAMCFSAVVSVNGKKCIIVSNAGRGGPDDLDPYHREGRAPTEVEMDAFKAGMALLEAYAKSLPVTEQRGTSAPVEVVETVIMKAVLEAMARKDFNREFRKLVHIVHDGKIRTLKMPLKDYHARTAEAKTILDKHYPGWTLLQDKPEDEAFALWYAGVLKEAADERH